MQQDVWGRVIGDLGVTTDGKIWDFPRIVMHRLMAYRHRQAATSAQQH